MDHAKFQPRPVRGQIPIWVVTTRGLDHIGPLLRPARVDGIVGGTSPQEVAQMLAIIQPERMRSTVFDVIIRYDLANPLPDSPEAIAIWEASGATWCRCELAVSFDHLSDARAFMRASPPNQVKSA